MKSLIFIACAIAVISATMSMPASVARMIAEGEVQLPHANNTSGSASPFRQCNTVKLNVCHQKFNALLGISSDIDWTNPAAFSYAINRVFNIGRDGYQKICTARQVYQGCLGASYFACIDPIFMIKQGLSRQVAFEYLTFMISLEFDCVQGLQVGIKDYECLILTSQTQLPAVNKCVTTFENSLQSGTSYCAASNTLAQCYAAIYRNGCNGSASGEAGWWICAELRRTLLADGGCNIQCPVESK